MNKPILETPQSISVPAPYRVRVNMDWDGVMGDFDGWCMTLFGSGSRSLSCVDERGQTLTGDPALWWHVDREPRFWLDMPLKGGAHELIEAAKPYGVQFLSGCPRQGYARAEQEKRVKFNRNFPGIHVVTCLSRHKMLHMQQPGDILVDDFISNIRRWQKEGGYAVYYKTHKQALADLKAGLIRQFGEPEAVMEADAKAKEAAK